MPRLNEEERYASDIMSAVTSLFDEESENYRYSLADIDATAFFTGFAMAFGLTFNRIAGGDEDLIGGTHLANRLAFQYLIKNGRAISEDDADE